LIPLTRACQFQRLIRQKLEIVPCVVEISWKAFKQLPDRQWPKTTELFMSAQVFAIQGNFPNAIWAQDQNEPKRNSNSTQTRGSSPRWP